MVTKRRDTFLPQWISIVMLFDSSARPQITEEQVKVAVGNKGGEAKEIAGGVRLGWQNDITVFLRQQDPFFFRIEVREDAINSVQFARIRDILLTLLKDTSATTVREIGINHDSFLLYTGRRGERVLSLLLSNEGANQIIGRKTASLTSAGLKVSIRDGTMHVTLKVAQVVGYPNLSGLDVSTNHDYPVKPNSTFDDLIGTARLERAERDIKALLKRLAGIDS